MENQEQSVRIQLEDLFPDKPEFILKKTGKIYKLRLPTLEDSVWLKKVYGSEENLANAIKRMDWAEIIKFIYRLLEDKIDFLPKEYEGFDDDGNAVLIKDNGPTVLLKSISGLEEGCQVLGAMTKAISAANPLIDKYLAESKKNHLESQIGPKSSMSSPANMGGPLSTSVVEP